MNWKFALLDNCSSYSNGVFLEGIEISSVLCCRIRLSNLGWKQFRMKKENLSGLFHLSELFDLEEYIISTCITFSITIFKVEIISKTINGFIVLKHENFSYHNHKKVPLIQWRLVRGDRVDSVNHSPQKCKITIFTSNHRHWLSRFFVLYCIQYLLENINNAWFSSYLKKNEKR